MEVRPRRGAGERRTVIDSAAASITGCAASAGNIPAFRWTAAGEMRTESAPAGDTVHAPYLKLTLSGALQLECQRCLAPYLHSLSIQMLYRIVETEQQADAAPLDNDQIEIIVGTR